jgi:ABC-type branched-subunit amino acid transport system substrate-binding protein
MLAAGQKVRAVARLAALTGIGILSVMAQTGGSRVVGDSGPSQLERRGKEIYFGIASPGSQPVRALIGDRQVEVDASVMACASCHGEDGTGRAEGGVVPSDITWDALTKPYTVANANGRTHPPYDERSLIRAICMGIDSGGHQLNGAMPKFAMTQQDAAALVSFLKKLGKDADPGVTDSKIRLATVLPTTGPLAGVGMAMRSMLTAYFSEINSQGGIYGRSVDLTIIDVGESPSETSRKIETVFKEEHPFAMVSGLITGIEKEIVSESERSQVPLVGPFTALAETGYAAKRTTFYLLSGIEQQSRALIDFSRENLKTPTNRLVLIYSEQVVPVEIVERLERYCQKSGFIVTTLNGGDTGGRNQIENFLAEPGASFLFLDSPDRTAAFASGLKTSSQPPLILIPGSVATNQLVDAQVSGRIRVYIALPSLPSDQTPEGALEYATLAKSNKLAPDHKPAQIVTLCAAKVLVQALKIAGRRLSKEKFLTALEGLTEFDTGFTPKISFGPNRRIGALGAYIVTVDPSSRTIKPVSGWIRLD